MLQSAYSRCNEDGHVSNMASLLSELCAELSEWSSLDSGMACCPDASVAGHTLANRRGTQQHRQTPKDAHCSPYSSACSCQAVLSVNSVNHSGLPCTKQTVLSPSGCSAAEQYWWHTGLAYDAMQISSCLLLSCQALLLVVCRATSLKCTSRGTSGSMPSCRQAAGVRVRKQQH